MSAPNEPLRKSGSSFEHEGSMSPSDAHDSAWRRDPGHDAMQLAVMRELVRSRRSVPRPDRPDGDGACFLGHAAAEHLFKHKSGRMFFADIALIYEARFPHPHDSTWNVDCEVWDLFEIKPRIHSAGAVLRQLAVLEHHLKAWTDARSTSPGLRVAGSVHVVVQASDPLAQTLSDLGGIPVLTWAGSDFGVITPSDSTAGVQG